MSRPVFGGAYATAPPRFARLTAVPGGLAFESTFDRSMVDQMKLWIPGTMRKWDPKAKWWLVSYQYAPVCVGLAAAYLGVSLTIPKHVTKVADETKIITLEYLATCKVRGDEASALGFADGDWSVVFPESVLRAWFCAEKNPTEKPTLYAVLGIKPDTAGPALQSAYRRLARQWHPDVCHEANAAEQFKIIQHAYEVLSEPRMRKKYDAGLWLEAKAKQVVDPTPYWLGATRKPTSFAPEYRSPLRCGYVLTHGAPVIGRFVVDEILEWLDITDDQGRSMVTSWPAGADKFEVAWR